MPTNLPILGQQEPSVDLPAPGVPNEGELKLIRAGQTVLMLMAVAAVAMIILAFQSWIDFGIVKTRGTDADALTGISDGYFVVALAAVVLVAAAGILARPRWTPALLPAIGAAMVAAFAIAGYDTATGWHTAGVDSNGAFILNGSPMAAPYAIAALAVTIAVLASVLAALRAGHTRSARD
jgi:hypothetical protein